MDLSFLSGKTPSSPIIQRDTDKEKYDKIVTKLCLARKSIEDDLSLETLSQEKKDELSLSLISAKQNLSVFGITEISYQAFLAASLKKQTPAEATEDEEPVNEDQLALF